MGKKLTVFMIDGHEYGPRTAEIGNWSGKAIYSPRPSLPKILHRDEFAKPAIYFLKSPSEGTTYTEKIYIGEAEILRNRIKQHLSDQGRDFSEFIAFISKDELLTKSQIRYLESRMIASAKDAKTSEIENSTAPALPFLSEADVSDMEYFLEQIRLILPVMGFRFLIPTVIAPPKHAEEISDFPFILKSTRLLAKLRETDQGYIVAKGSQCSKDTVASIAKVWQDLREKLIGSSTLVEQDDVFVFTEDTVFSSTSAAASVILGRQASGPVAWVDPSGKTYKEHQEQSPS